jgi:hypothetical protein
LATDYFSEVFGSATKRGAVLNLDGLSLPSLTRDHARELEAPFSREEVRKTIMEMPSDRAPGPDGFFSLFFKLCWEIIADDMLAALEFLHRGQDNNFRRLNSLILILLSKKEDPLNIKDYRPISLIHSFSKILTKILVARLAPMLTSIVSLAQCAFVQSRSIHEKYKLVANTARFLHRKKSPAVLMKIDISKAFDTLSWEVLLKILRLRGFGASFCNLICGILPSAHTTVMINGERGVPIQLARGVRQGDPLSPTLFILAMDSLHASIQWAAEQGVLADLCLHQVTRVNLTNVLGEGLTIGEIGRRMNSKVKLVKQGVY